MHPLKKFLFTVFGALILLALSPLLLLLAIIIFPIEWLGRFFEKQKMNRSAYPLPYRPGITKTVCYQVFCHLSEEQKNNALLLSDWEIFLPGSSPLSLLAPEASCLFIAEEAPDGIVCWESGDWIAEDNSTVPPVRINLSAKLRDLDGKEGTVYVLFPATAKTEGLLPENFHRFSAECSFLRTFQK
jgi:hypothetical protein